MTREKLLKEYVKLGKKLKSVPSVADCTNSGLQRHMIRYYFGNMTNLKKVSKLEKVYKLQPKDKSVVYSILGVNSEKRS